jgi:hypothetical protein
MVDEAAAALRASLLQGLLEGVQDEAGVGGAADAPADDPPGVGVDHKGDVDEARPGGDVGEIRQPQPVGRRRVELAVHMVERAWRDCGGSRSRSSLSSWPASATTQMCGCGAS